MKRKVFWLETENLQTAADFASQADEALISIVGDWPLMVVWYWGVMCACQDIRFEHDMCSLCERCEMGCCNCVHVAEEV